MKLPVRYDALTSQQKRMVREAYCTLQGDLCLWCRAPLSGPPAPDQLVRPVDPRLFPRGFFRYSVHLQHSHVTGMTEGAVHAHCNAIMWQYYGK